MISPGNHKPKSASQVLVRNTAWVYGAKIVSQAVGFIALLLVIKKIDVEVFGKYNLYLSLFMLFGVFAISPSLQVLRRYLPQFRQAGDYSSLVRISVISHIVAATMVALCGIAFWLLQGPLGRFLQLEEMADTLGIFFLYVIFHAARSLISTMLASLLLHKAISILQISSSFLRTGLYIFLLPHLTVSLLLGIEAVVALSFAAPAAVCLLHWLRGYRRAYKSVPVSTVPIDGRKVVRYGAFGLLNEIGSGVIGRTSDYYIVSALGTPVVVGLYAFAARLFDYFIKLLPLDEFLSVLRPVYIARFTGGCQASDSKQVFNFITKVMLPLHVFPGLLFFALGRPIIATVFDSRYLPAYWVAVCVLFMTLPMAFAIPLGLVAELKERMDIAFCGKVVALLSLPLGILAMKHFGLVAVAAVTLACDMLKVSVIYFLMMRIEDVRICWRALSGFAISWVVLGAGFYALQSHLVSLSATLAAVALFCILFLVTIVLFHPFTDYDIELLDKLCARTRGSTVIRPAMHGALGLRQRIVSWVLTEQN